MFAHETLIELGFVKLKDTVEPCHKTFQINRIDLLGFTYLDDSACINTVEPS